MQRFPVPLLALGAAGVCLLLAVVLLLTSPGARSAREAEGRRAEMVRGAGAGGADAPRLPTVTVDAATVETTEARTVVEVAGILSPVREVVIGAEVEGRVVSLEAREHTAVDRGDLLVRLDPALPQAAVARARAALLRAEAAEQLAAADVARQRELSKQGVASEAVLDRSESEDRAAAAQVAEARAELLDAETRLAKTEIRAPFDGVVSSLDLEPGAYLRPGEPVAGLADLSEVEIEVGVSDQEILAIRHGQAVALSVDAVPGRSFAGRVVNPGRTADAQTRKYPVPVRVPNAEGELLAGMLGTVRFELGDGSPVLRVPRRSVRAEFDLEYLFVVEATNGSGAATARRRRVTIRPVAFHPELLEVTSGLEAGERVVTSGVGELRDGLLVRLRDVPAPAP